MLGLGWSELGTISTIVSILLAVIPAVIRFRQVLLKSQDLITEFVGILVLMGGLYIYVSAMPQWVQIQDQIGRLSPASGPGLEQDMQSLHILFFGSIGLMMLGGLLTLFGVLGRVMTGPKNAMTGPKRK